MARVYLSACWMSASISLLQGGGAQPFSDLAGPLGGGDRDDPVDAEAGEGEGRRPEQREEQGS